MNTQGASEEYTKGLETEIERLNAVLDRLGDDRNMADNGDMPIPSSMELDARIEYARNRGKSDD